MIYFCEHCNNYFDDTDRECYREEVEWHSELGAECGHYPERIVMKICPNCGSGDYEEASTCPLCGELYHNDDAVCPDCANKIRENVNRLVEDLSFNGHNKFTDNKDTVVTWIAENL